MGKFVVNKDQALKIITYFFSHPLIPINGRPTKMKPRDMTLEQVKFAELVIQRVIDAVCRMGVIQDLYESSAGSHPSAIEIIITVAEGYKGHVRTRARNRRNPLSTSSYNTIRTQVRASYRSDFERIFDVAQTSSGWRTGRQGI